MLTGSVCPDSKACAGLFIKYSSVSSFCLSLGYRESQFTAPLESSSRALYSGSRCRQAREGQLGVGCYLVVAAPLPEASSVVWNTNVHGL